MDNKLDNYEAQSTSINGRDVKENLREMSNVFDIHKKRKAVYALALAGATQTAIANKLGLTRAAVSYHISYLLKKDYLRQKRGKNYRMAYRPGMETYNDEEYFDISKQQIKDEASTGEMSKPDEYPVSNLQRCQRIPKIRVHARQYAFDGKIKPPPLLDIVEWTSIKYYGKYNQTARRIKIIYDEKGAEMGRIEIHGTKNIGAKIILPEVNTNNRELLNTLDSSSEAYAWELLRVFAHNSGFSFEGTLRKISGEYAITEHPIAKAAETHGIGGKFKFPTVKQKFGIDLWLDMSKGQEIESNSLPYMIGMAEAPGNINQMRQELEAVKAQNAEIESMLHESIIEQRKQSEFIKQILERKPEPPHMEAPPGNPAGYQ